MGSQTCERAVVRSGDEVKAGTAAPGSLGSCWEGAGLAAELSVPEAAQCPQHLLVLARGPAAVPVLVGRRSGHGADGAGVLRLQGLLPLHLFRNPPFDPDQVQLAVKLAGRKRDAVGERPSGGGGPEGAPPTAPGWTPSREPGCAVSQPGDQRAWPAHGHGGRARSRPCGGRSGPPRCDSAWPTPASCQAGL